MKTINNTEYSIKIDDRTNATVSSLALAVLNSPVKEGFTGEELRRIVRVGEVLEKAGDIIELEDSDYDFLKAKVENHRWGVVHKDIVEFLEIFNVAT